MGISGNGETVITVVKRKHFVAALLAAAVSVGVHAEQSLPAPGWYAAGNVGQAKVRIEDLDLASLNVTGSESKDETDTAWRLALGHRFNPYVAVEGGYVDFGDFSQKATITAPVSGSFVGDVKARGWFVDAVGTYPLGAGFSVLGRVGTVRSTTRTSFSTTGALAAAGIDARVSESEWNWHYGAGLQFDVTPSIGLRLEYDQTRNVGKQDTTGEGNIDVWSLGAVLRF